MSDQHPDENNGLLNFIALTVESMRDQMATKSDLKSLSDVVTHIGGEVETMRDQMATKSDLARLEAKMDANFAAVRGDTEQVQLRVDSIDRAIRAPR